MAARIAHLIPRSTHNFMPPSFWQQERRLGLLVRQKLLKMILMVTPFAAAPEITATTITNGEAVLQLTDATYASKANALLQKISEKYQLSALDNIAKGTSSAQSLATMGAGTAFAAGKHSVILGGGLGVAINGGNAPLGDAADKLRNLDGDTLPRFGIGAQLSAVTGFNLSLLRTPRYLGPLELARMTVLANIFHISSNSLDPGLALSATVLGLNAQYTLLYPRGKPWLTYGEVLLLTGINYSRLNARYDSRTGTKALTPTTVGAGTVADPQLTWTPSGIIQISSGSVTIPIEAVTHVRLFYFFSLYLGAALDFNFGSAGTEIDFSGPLSGSMGGAPTTVGNGSMAAQRGATPAVLSGRGIAGFQLNLLPGAQKNIVGILTQVNLSSLNGLSVQTGFRCAY